MILGKIQSLKRVQVDKLRLLRQPHEILIANFRGQKMRNKIRSTTILGVINKGEAALGGDGQVSLGNTVMKHNAMKIRKIANGSVLCGFAGATADAFTLMERFEDKLEQYRGNLSRAAVELAKDWRLDRALRRLEALLIVADLEHSFIISGTDSLSVTSSTFPAAIFERSRISLMMLSRNLLLVRIFSR